MEPQLNGKQLKSLHDTLRKAFLTKDLEMLLRFELDEDLGTIVSRTQNHEIVVFRLLEWAEQNGRMLELVKAASAKRDRNDTLRNLVSILEQESDSGEVIPVNPVHPPAPPQSLAVIENLQPLPAMEDIFEIINDPGQVLGAIFDTEPWQDRAPFDNDYVSRREETDNLQQALLDELEKERGLLLVKSREGLGKTREVSELAKEQCRNRWTICIAKKGNEFHRALNRPQHFPDYLWASRLLLIFDDIHRPIVSDDSTRGEPYIERFKALLDFIEVHIGRANLRVLATVRSEYHYPLERSGFFNELAEYVGFSTFELPEFKSNDLANMLIERANMFISDRDARDLVENSDRTPRTLFNNIDRARGNIDELRGNWKQTGAESWRSRFLSARRDYPAAADVFQAIYLLREAGLAARVPYVVQLGVRLHAMYPPLEIKNTAKLLVDFGLLGQRNNILNPFSDTQLVDSLQYDDETLPVLDSYWDQVIEAVKGIDMSFQSQDWWLEDLVTLCERLFTIKHFDDAIAVAGSAIERGNSDAIIFYYRGLARLGKNDYAEAEADFNAAIERDQDNADFYFRRGTAKLYLGDTDGAVEDFGKFVEHGQDTNRSSGIKASLGRPYRIFVTAIGKLVDTIIAQSSDADQPDRFYLRGVARLYDKQYDKAEKDLRRAVELGNNFAEIHSYLGRALSLQGSWEDAAEAYKCALQLEPSRAEDWVSLATAYRQADNDQGYREAIASAQMLVEENDLYNRARLASVADDPEASTLFIKAKVLKLVQADWLIEDPALYWVRKNFAV